MIKRSVFPIAVLGLLASLAFVTPSRADSFIVNVTEGFSLSDLTTTPTISSLTLQFSGLTDGISNLTFTGSAFTGPTVGPVTPTLSGNAATETVTLTFSPSVWVAAGAISFNTVTSTADLPTLQSQITLVSETVVSSANTQAYNPLHFEVVGTVPEPGSMSLIGVGMAGLLAFRRWYKRFAIA